MIEIIFTGGTIGSRAFSDGSVSVDRERGYRLISMYEEKYGALDYRPREPYRILSENFSLAKLKLLADAVGDALKGKPEGVIITHGTDSLPYAAAFLSYLFADAQAPVVLVSSNYILDDPRANGLDNFKYAVDFIRSRAGRGVFVSYRNSGGAPMIHRGSRLQNAPAFSDDVSSVLGGEYGGFASGVFLKSADYRVAESNDNSFLKYSSDDAYESAQGSVLWLRSQLALPDIIIPEGVRAVLLDSFHSGTVGTEGLRGVLEQAKERGLPVFLTGLSSGATQYETILKYAENGIIPLIDRAPVSQYSKLLLLIAKKKDIPDGMARACGEEI